MPLGAGEVDPDAEATSGNAVAVIITDAPSANAPPSGNSQNAAESSNKVVDLEAGRPRRVKREFKQDVDVEDIDCWGDSDRPCDTAEVTDKSCNDWGDDDCTTTTKAAAAGAAVAGGAGAAGGADAAAGGPGGSEGEDSEKGQGVMASVWNTGVALPSLVGTWCWPLVFAWIFVIAWYNVPVGLTMLFYALELALMAVVVTNVFQYAHWLNKRRRAGNKDDNAVRLIGWSIPLNLAFPLAVCVIYIGGYGLPEYKMWTEGSFTPNTPFGVTLWVIKWIGFIMMTVGLVRITNMHKKISKKYKDNRTGKANKAAAQKK